MLTEIPLSRPDTPLLDQISSPADLKTMDPADFPDLARELRNFLLYSVGQTGGHFGAGLGVVELTIALHYVFDTPEDRLIWDVGHQSYPHKILTGRRERMLTMRQPGGLAAFPCRTESDYDCFGVGHSSTSISAALGMMIAARRQEAERHVIAVIGDGAMTAGMAFEALNHAGELDDNVLVILNDNNMSISRNVGGLSSYFARMWASKPYNFIRTGSKKMLSKIPPALKAAHRAEEYMKGMVSPGTLFEEIGFNYIGLVDGHDTERLIEVLGNIKQLRGPQLLHIVTQKGKGYTASENDPFGMHALSKIEAKPKRPTSEPKTPTYSQVFGQWLCDMAQQDEKLIAITPAMSAGSGMDEFADQYPDRFFDVAIAEQHAVTFGAGLAKDGMNAVVAIYSSFLQRAYDQLIHDVAIQDLPVLFAIDRAGIVGADGPTHQGAFDIAFLRCIPNMVVMAPSDENECRQMLYTGHKLQKPAAVRYPRGAGMGVTPDEAMTALEIGKSRTCRETAKDKSESVAILNFGCLLPYALEAAVAIDATVIDMRFIKPLDGDAVLKAANEHSALITLEDGCIMGGAGSAVLEHLQQNGVLKAVKMLGLPDSFILQGTQQEMYKEHGLDAEGIIAAAKSLIG